MSKILTELRTLATLESNQQTFRKHLIAEGKSFVKRENMSGIAALDIRARACFRNAALITLVRPEQYAYWEGFYLCEGMPISFEHAWNVRKGAPNGVICDATAQVYGIPVEE